MLRTPSLFSLAVLIVCQVAVAQQELRPVSLTSSITAVQPMTGLVLWSDNEAARSDAIQLEYCYMRYDDVVTGPGQYDWTSVDRLLSEIASRKHQALLRFYFVYPGKKSSVPAYIKGLPDYDETAGKSEGEDTTFCDWTNETLRQATLDFYTEFAKRYDNDARLAFLQTGFGLWAEYHIYDGPMELGKTFPSRDYQKTFINHLAKTFVHTPWSVSVDAADDEWSPLAEDPTISSIGFGLFDDSFLCKQHARENAKNWAAFGSEKWKKTPAGGEISYYNKRDQKFALAEKGPNGVKFEDSAKQFHITYMIADGQTEHASVARIKEASMSLGYQFRVTSFSSGVNSSNVEILNEGIAPLYHDAFVTVNSFRSLTSLKGLLPGETKTFTVAAGSQLPTLTIESDRLVDGQSIQFNADLKGK